LNNESLLVMLLGDRFTTQLAGEISGRKETIFREAIRGKAVLLPGVITWLERLSDWGVSQAVASSAPEENIDALITELGIRGFFQAAISGTGFPGKPNPDVFLKAARAIQVPPKGCIVIEDAVAGVEAAHRAGMKCVAVLTTNPATRLGQADVIVERLDQLPTQVMRDLLGMAG
jgi:beta-phosphoglucomutase